PIERPIVRATGQDVPGATNVEARAKQLVAAGEAKTVEEATNRIFATEPETYSAYLASLK
ncbi:hypothetical protein JIN85_21200, partial [Luteolibacter pohnpeiensis]